MANPRVDLKDHMRQLWAEVGFKTDTFELTDGRSEVDEDIEKEARSFTPLRCPGPSPPRLPRSATLVFRSETSLSRWTPRR